MKFKSFLLFLYISLYLSSRAPDKAPNLPDGWCNLKYGSPTKSTGECICKYRCVGSGCKNEHGLNWYEYKVCPTCKCVSLNGESENEIKKESISKKEEVEVTKKDINKEKEKEKKVKIEQRNQQYEQAQQSQESQQGENIEETPEEENVSFLDILEENSRVIFAGIVTIVVFGLVFCGLFLPSSPSSSSNK